MTSTTPPSPAPFASLTVLTVALLGVGTPSPQALQTALENLSASPGVTWAVVTGETAGPGVQIVVCGSPARITEARCRWPDAVTVALVPVRDDGPSVMAALDIGAGVCVRGEDPSLVAAYVRSIARRRHLLDVAGTER